MGAVTAQEFHFADFTLDQSRYRLQRGEDILRLEKRPMELLILLIERRGELVSREEIAERLWGKDVFVDVDRSINTAISKVRVALRDDPENPRFVETVVGKGYRFAAPVICGNGDSSTRSQNDRTSERPVDAEGDHGPSGAARTSLEHEILAGASRDPRRCSDRGIRRLHPLVRFAQSETTDTRSG